MSGFLQGIIIISVFIILLSICFSVIAYIYGKEKGQKIKREEYYDDVIKEILGQMYIDEAGNNVLNGGTEEYERKWKYEIGHNYGLQKTIRILKAHINNTQ